MKPELITRIAHEELYVSIRKLHDMAMERIVTRCTMFAVGTVLEREFCRGFGIKPVSTKKQARAICGLRQAYDKVPVGELLRERNKE